MKYKYLAVRKPVEIKGVYTNKEKIKEIHRTYDGKELSCRNFEETEKAAALAWAKVKEITDDKKEVTLNKKQQIAPSNNKDSKEDIIKDILKIFQENQNTKAKEFIEIVNKYKENGFTYILINLNSGEEYGIVLYNFADGCIENNPQRTLKENIEYAINCSHLEIYKYASTIHLNGHFIMFDKLWTLNVHGIANLKDSHIKAINVDNIASITPCDFKYIDKTGYKKELSKKSIDLYNKIEQYL